MIITNPGCFVVVRELPGTGGNTPLFTPRHATRRSYPGRNSAPLRAQTDRPFMSEQWRGNRPSSENVDSFAPHLGHVTVKNS